MSGDWLKSLRVKIAENTAVNRVSGMQIMSKATVISGGTLFCLETRTGYQYSNELLCCLCCRKLFIIALCLS